MTKRDWLTDVEHFIVSSFVAMLFFMVTLVGVVKMAEMFDSTSAGVATNTGVILIICFLYWLINRKISDKYKNKRETREIFSD